MHDIKRLRVFAIGIVMMTRPEPAEAGIVDDVTWN
jgi:hypothetical protein